METETSTTPPPPPGKDVPRSKIPVPASVYVGGGRSNYLTDLSEQVYAEEQKELARAREEQRRLRVRRRGRRKRSGGEGSDFSEEEDLLAGEPGYGPPGLLATVQRKSSKDRKRRYRPRDEVGDSSIELLGSSASLETDEEFGPGDHLSDSFDEDVEGRGGSDTGYKRYSERVGTKRKEYRKSKTLGGEPDVRGTTGGKGGQSKGKIPGIEDGPKRYPGELRRRRKEEKHGDKWRREPGRPLSSTGHRHGSKSKSKSPADHSKERRRKGDKDRSPFGRRSKERDGSREKRNKEDHMSPQEKVEKWKRDAEDRKKKQWSRYHAEDLSKKGDKLKVPGTGLSDSDGDGAAGGANKRRQKYNKKEEDPEWNSKEQHMSEEKWRSGMPHKPPSAFTPGFALEGLSAAELEDVLKEDAVRDAAAIMRMMQLCKSGDWYGVDGHLKYFEKRIQSGLTKNTTPLQGVRDDYTGWTPLMFAIKDNRCIVADRMIDLGSDVNVMGRDGYSAIHIAALHGRDDTIRFLLFKNADATLLTDVKKQNVLHIAASRQTGNAQGALRALLTAVPKEARMQMDWEGNIPMTIALKNGQKGAVQELLSQDPELQLAVTMGEFADTPLHVAARKKDLETYRLLVDGGGNIDATNKLGQTPLHIASEVGDDSLAKYLFLCKANPHLADNEDRTAIHLAAIHGHTGLIDILADKFKVSVFERTRDGSTLMHIASLHGHPETAMALFRKGVPLQMPNKNGARSIHIAARHGHASMIARLLEKGEKVDAITNDNFTALHIATEAVKPNVVETLLGYGAHVHIKGGKEKETPLHIAGRVVGGEKCALMLLKSGADPNIIMENGETPLHVAARHGRMKIIQLLLMDGGNPQHRAAEGDTPLHLACRHGHIRVVQVLLEHVRRKLSENECTLYINMVTVKGETALHYSARLNADKITLNKSEEDLKKEDIGRDIVKLLLDGGASTSRLTKETNETCFHYACKEGNNDVLKEMLSRLNVVECQRSLNRQSAKGWSPLLIACRRGHTSVVQTLLDFHARVDVFDTEGRSGLHLAAENGYQEICGILLEHKAFINAKSRVGLTALHLASMKGFTRLCLFLINDHGAAVDALTLKKQTPLHLAAEGGQLEVSRLLMGLRANPDATDDKGQKPIHLAAQNNHAEVIKLFLKHSSALVNSFTKDGSTCAHLAAMQGSVAVLEELMKFDKQGVINARNRSTDATALQLAAEGGHSELVKTLLVAGASASDENRLGYTAAHLAAKNGHTHVLEELRHAQSDSINLTSRKLGMTALHIAAFYGQTETVRELLQFIPATSTTDPPLTVATSFIKELGSESGLTPLHMASYSGEENVVRLLLNFEGVQVDAPTTNLGFNPLHLACRGGHSTVVGLLLSRSSELLESKDASGKASLHIAAINGHKYMVEVLLGQGAEIDAIDKELWTPLICASKAGHLDVIKLLVESGASPLGKNAKGQSAIFFAAAENHVDVLNYLMKKEHDTYGLMEDKDFVFNLTVCGKNINNEPIDEFVLSSPAPVEVAAKMSNFLVYVSTREKERAKDLLAASKHCESMATELLALAAAAETPEKILEAIDRRGVEFLDVLIENEQKEVIAHTVVQRHLQEIWVGQLVEWPDWQLLLVFLICVMIPAVWVTMSMPFGPSYNRIPIIRFMSYLTSHIHLMLLLCLTCVTPIHPVFPIRTNLWPFWFEWMLLAWLGGLLVAEITNPSDKSGLGWIKVAVLFFCYLGIILHGCAFFMDKSSYGTVLYLRDQLLGCGVLLACVQILDFLSFHYLFGPWAIIIGNLMKDLARFLAVLTIFMVGFSLVVSSLNHPIHPRRKAIDGEKLPKALTNGLPSGVLVTPVDAFELLFFALFGLNNAGDMKIEVLGQPDWTIILFKIFFGVYLLVTVIVLINLLIAMMSDTYQRIEAQSDIEWKFGLAKLIRSIHRTTVTPSPLNLFVDWGTWIYRQIKKARQPKNKLRWQSDKSRDGSGGGVLDQAALAQRAAHGGSIIPAPGAPASLKQMQPPEQWGFLMQKYKMKQIAAKLSNVGAASGMGSFASSTKSRSNTQIGAALMGDQPGAGELTASQELATGGSGLSVSAQNRIESVTDWTVIAKKYRILMGREERVEEHEQGDEQGSRSHGSSSAMGDSRMVQSRQAM